MKKNLITLLCIAVLVGCNDESLENVQDQNLNVPDQSTVKVENGRMVFRDTDSFFKTVSAVSNMSESDLKAWEAKYPITTLAKHLESKHTTDVPYTDEEAEYNLLPNSYQILLNKDGEVKIGNTIVWYINGAKHYADNEDQLKMIKANPSKSIKKSEYHITRQEIDPAKLASGQRINLNIGAIDARHQKEFAYCVNNTPRKYVHELYALYDNVEGFSGGFSFHTALYLRIKLEWKGSGGWKLAGEYRFINYDFSSSIGFNISNGGAPVADRHWSIATVERNSQLDVKLFDGSFNYYNGTFTPNYEVEIIGKIYQAISNKIPAAPGGTACNAWTNGKADYILW